MTWVRALMISVIVIGVFAIVWLPEARQALAPTTAEQAADFPNYYFGGERLREGRPVYDTLESEVHSLFGISGYTTYPADPPSTVVLFAPLSLVDYETAWKVWQAVSAALLVGSVLIVSLEVGYSPRIAVVLSAISLLTTPARFLLERNHMEAALLLLGVLGWRSLRRGSVRRASILWGIATGLKLFPGMWLLGLFDRHRRRHMVLGLGVAVGLLGVGGLMLGGANVAQFLTETIPDSRQWYGTLGNYSLLSVGSAFVGSWLGWLLVGVALVVLLPRYLADPSSPDRTFVLGTVLALLISPLSWLNYLVLVIPALIIVSRYLDLVSNARHRIGLAVLTLSLMSWGPIATANEFVSELASYVPTYGLICLFLVAHRVIRAPATSPARAASLEVGLESS